MKLGVQVGLISGHILLDGDPGPPPPKGRSPQFLARVYCGQTTAWIKIPLAMEVGLSQGHIVLHGDSVPLPKKGDTAPPIFSPCLLWPNGWMGQDATWYDGRPWPGQHCVRCRPSSTPRGTAPPNCGPCLLWPNDSMDQDATHFLSHVYCGQTFAHFSYC